MSSSKPKPPMPAKLAEMMAKRKKEQAKLMKPGGPIRTAESERAHESVEATFTRVNGSGIVGVQKIAAEALPPAPLRAPPRMTLSQDDGDDSPPPLADLEEEDDDDDVETEEVLEEGKTQTRRCIESFRDKLPHLHDLMMDNEVSKGTNTPCDCGSGLLRDVRCGECKNRRATCRRCFIARHRDLWDHWVQVWQTEGFFGPQDIHTIGFIPQIGHNGDACPVPHHPVKVIIVDINGVHDTKVQFCGCDLNTSPNRLEQFMHDSMFPASTARPELAFTFRLLRHIQLLHVECTANTYDINSFIQRCTDNKYPWAAPDVSKQLRRVLRIWHLMKEERRTGYIVEKNKHAFPTRQADSLLVYCPLCPEQGVSMEEDWQSTPPEFDHLIAAENTTDGNFKMAMGTMNSDVVDVDLLKGRGLQPLSHEMEAYRASAIPSPTNGSEKIPCNNLKAASQQHVRNADCVYNGICQFQCGHVFVKATADFPKGEDQKTNDMVVKLGYERSGFPPLSTSEVPDEKRKQPSRFSYDSNCQYCVYVDHRFQHKDLKSMREHIRNATKIINAAHVYAHAGDCIYRFGCFYMEGLGHFHGETCEHFWPKSNGFAPMIFKMNLHHGHETYFNIAMDWNYLKEINAPNEVHREVRYARTMYLRYKAEFQIASQQNEADIRAWAAEWADRHQPGKHYRQTGKGKNAVITSPYKHREVKLPCLDGVLSLLVANPLTLACVGNVTSDKLAGWICDGISFSIRKLHLSLLIVRVAKYPSASDDEDIRRERESLKKDMNTWLRLRKQYFGDLEPYSGRHVRAKTRRETKHYDTKGASGKVEEWELCLPSELSAEAQAKIGPAVDQEVAMREALAFQSIRLAVLIARELLALGYDKKKNAKYTGPMTKARERISRAKWRRDVAIANYNEHRIALLNLNALERTKLAGLEAMTVEDTYVAKSVDGVRQPLDSSRQDGQAYLWNRGYQTTNMGKGYSERARKHMLDGEDEAGPSKRRKPNRKASNKKKVKKDLEAWEKDGERVRWFRLEAEMRRWREHHERKQTEFLNLIRNRTHERDAWKDRAIFLEKTRPEKPGYIAYAREQAARYNDGLERAKRRAREAGYGHILEASSTEPFYKHCQRVRNGKEPMYYDENDGQPVYDVPETILMDDIYIETGIDGDISSDEDD
ncbi:hypothetical protein BDZ89DRAFT_1161242 [Hymenopellis radicata]|nr:hypothetical protein BDZ89DRAFT_1161242 [Hymenopellis radicata]